MTSLRAALPVLMVLIIPPGFLNADSNPANGKTIAQVVDEHIDAKLKREGVKAAGQVDDANFLRRATLDLAGRIPTVMETKSFLESADPDKRTKLVERLMSSAGFVRHLANELDVMLMEGNRSSIREYLVKALQERRTWDQIFRDLLLPDDKDPKQKGASEFLRPRLRDVDQLTSDVSSLFFGVNVSCAKCHDHPLVQDWKMDHYYGMKSFFARTYSFGNLVAEREFAEVKFKGKDGKDRQAKLMFLGGQVVEDPFAKDAPVVDKNKSKKKGRPNRKGSKGMPPPPPRFSARAQLVKLALDNAQPHYFSRAIVNRVWHRFLGQGLVMPLDQMHSANPPSHPELLDYLAKDLVASKYDLSRLIRGLVLSQTYARNSRWESDKKPLPRLFAVGLVRALTPMQLANSLTLATSDPDLFYKETKAEAVEKRLEGLENRARGWSRFFDQPKDNFQVSVSEALLFSNNERMQQEFLSDGGDRLLGRLKQTKDRGLVIDTAVRAVLSRAATPQEVKLFSEFLQRRENRLMEGYRQMVWALVTSSEFRFNY